MPKGPRGEKRPADVVGAAVMVAKGEIPEQYEPEPEKDDAAVSLGGTGGAARAERLSAEQRAAAVGKALRQRQGKSPKRMVAGESASPALSRVRQGGRYGRRLLAHLSPQDRSASAE